MSGLMSSLRGRPLLVAVALLNLITGTAWAVTLIPLSFGADAEAFRRGALAVAAGQMDKDFLYAPLAAAIASPLAWIPEVAAAGVMTTIGFLLLMAGVFLETRGAATVDRLLVAIAATTFLPVINELILGQVTFVFAAALWPVLRSSDRARNGIPFGIALALAPKPVFVPLLFWMLIWRPKSLAGTAIAGVLTATSGVLLMGADLHLKWLAVLTATGTAARAGNRSIWADGGATCTGRRCRRRGRRCNRNPAPGGRRTSGGATCWPAPRAVHTHLLRVDPARRRPLSGRGDASPYPPPCTGWKSGDARGLCALGARWARRGCMGRPAATRSCPSRSRDRSRRRALDCGDA